MKRAELTELALADLEETWEYISKANPAAADRYVEFLHAKCQELAEFPGMGRERRELSPGLRGFPIDNYIIYYRETEFGIDVIRKLSGFRDIPARFEIE